MFEMMRQIKFRLERKNPERVRMTAYYEQRGNNIVITGMTDATGEEDLGPSDPLAILVTEFIRANFSRLWKEGGTGKGKVSFTFSNWEFACRWDHELETDMREEYFTAEFSMRR